MRAGQDGGDPSVRDGPGGDPTPGELPGGPRWPPVWSLVALAAALGTGAVLRFRDLGGPTLWTDELVSWWAASADGPGEVLARVSSCMATPPLSFLLQHASVAAFGESEWALRLPSALAGLAAIPVVVLAGWRMFGAAAGAVAAAFLAIHPFHLWWTTDGRPYGLAVLLAAGSVWALSEAVRTGRTAAVAAWALCTAGLMYAQFIFLPLPAAQVAVYVVLWRTGRAAALPATRAAAALGGAAILCLPLLPQMVDVARRAPGLTWPAFVGNYPPGIYGLLQTTALVTAALVFLGYAAFRRRGEEPVLPDAEGERSADVLAVVLMFLLPLLGVGAVAFLYDLPTLIKPRYGAAYLAPAVLLVAWLVTRPRRPAGRVVFALTFLLLEGATAVMPPIVRGESFNQNANVEDWRAALGLLDSEWRPGDVVLLRSGLIETEALYDGKFPEECSSYVAAPLSGLYVDNDVEPLLLPMQFAESPPPEYAERFGRHLAGKRRVWLVMMHPTDPGTYYGRVESYVRQAAGIPLQLARAGSFGPVTVALLAVTPDPPG